MLLDLKPYPAYKEPAVPWLGAVPEHWQVRQLGRIGRLFKGNGGSREDDAATGVPCIRYGDLYTTYTNFIRRSRFYIPAERATDYTPIKHGDVLFAASGETIDDIGKSAVNLMQSPVYCGGDIIVFRPRIEVDSRFMGYVTDCWSTAAIKASMGRGITVKHIYGDQLKYLSIALPSLAEQTAIVRFLDHVDRRILRYMRAKQKLIKLLGEQKQAIIHRAVSRGLDPGVGLKPSGAEWLGDVPVHWEVMRVKQTSTILRGKFSHRPRNDPEFYDGPYPFLQTGDIARASKLITSFSQSLNDKGLAVSKMFPKGTLAMTIAANIGDVAILDFDACFPDSVVGFVPSRLVHRDFLYYAFRSMKADLLLEAPVNTQGNLNIERIGSRVIPVPPLDEQEQIVRSIESDTRVMEAATAKAQQQVQLVREYRTRLIADVVTGKLDVREAAARLPVEVEEPDDLRLVDETLEGGEEAEELASGELAGEEVVA